MNRDEESFLIQKVLTGEVRYFEPLIMKYQDMVFTLALRIVKNRDDAQEVAQDTFLKAYQNLNSYQSKAKFSTWIYRICINQAISKTRGKHFTQEQKSIQINEDQHDFKSLNDTLLQIENQEREKIVKTAIKKLPDEYGILLTLFYLEELSIEETSEILQLSISNVKVKLFRARKKFKTLLLKSFGEELKQMDVWKETSI